MGFALVLGALRGRAWGWVMIGGGCRVVRDEGLSVYVTDTVCPSAPSRTNRSYVPLPYPRPNADDDAKDCSILLTQSSFQQYEIHVVPSTPSISDPE